MMKRVFLLLGCLVPWFITGVQATTLHNLYELTVKVANQSDQARTQGINDAFDLLLVRVTGDSTMPQQERVVPLRAKAPEWVRQFRYERVTPPPVPVSEGSTEMVTPEPYLQMHIRFDEEAVSEALWQNRMPVWGKTRPAVLVWVVMQDANGRFFIDPNEPNPFFDSLRTSAQRRGLPLVVPLMDLEDQININVNDVWAGFSDTIQQASQRYAPEAILVGRVSADFTGGWQVRWTLLQQGQSRSWSEENVTGLDLVAALGIDGVADDLAQHYAHVGGDDTGAYVLEVSDVKNLNDYARVTRYIKSLSSVEGVELATVWDEHLSYRVTLRGNIGSVEQAIALGSTLKPEQQERFSDRILVYRLQP